MTNPRTEAGFTPLSEFIAKIDRKGVEEFGWLRWRLWRIIGRIRVRWFVFRNRGRPLTVSQEAFAAFTKEDIEETLAEIIKFRGQP